MITVRFFASFREQLGTDSEQIEAEGLPDVASVIRMLRARGGVWANVFSEQQTVMMAVNQDVAEQRTAIKNGDEVAFFPPVTGG